MTGTNASDDFGAFVDLAEPKLRRALAAAYGASVGREAALDALSWGWEHWDRLSQMANPVGYLYRVGQSRATEHFDRIARTATLDVATASESVELTVTDTDLPEALGALTEQQRTAVVLVHGYGVSLRETAQLMNVSVATVRKHSERAMKYLRTSLEVSDVG